MSIIYSEPKEKEIWKIEYREKDGSFFYSYSFWLVGWCRLVLVMILGFGDR